MTFHLVGESRKAAWIAIVDNRESYGRISGVKFRAALSGVNKAWLGEEVGVARTAFNNYSLPDRATIGLLRFRQICEALEMAPADFGFEPDIPSIEQKIQALQETLAAMQTLTADRQDLPWVV